MKPFQWSRLFLSLGQVVIKKPYFQSGKSTLYAQLYSLLLSVVLFFTFPMCICVLLNELMQAEKESETACVLWDVFRRIKLPYLSTSQLLIISG